MPLTLQGKIVRRIELRTGVSENDRTESLIAITEIAPGMSRVYLLAGSAGQAMRGTEKTTGIVSKAQAVKLAETLRDDRLRRGFTLTRDWSWPTARFLRDTPPIERSLHIQASELPAQCRGVLAAVF
jgi:hypothetical protein